MGVITSASLLNQFGQVNFQLLLRGFRAANSVCDGAVENRSFIRASASVPASHFFSLGEATKLAARGVNIDFYVAFESLDKPGDVFAFCLSDFPQAIKKIGNALELASLAKNLRDLEIPAGFNLNGAHFFTRSTSKCFRTCERSIARVKPAARFNASGRSRTGTYVKNAFTRMCA
jgi:hypothetical protein